MCNCSSSFFISLPVLDAPVRRPNSDNCSWIQHSIINCSWRSHVSIHQIYTLSCSKTRAPCYFGGKNLAFIGKFSCFKEKSSYNNFVSRLSSSLPNEKDVVQHQTVDNDTGELPRESDLIRVKGENDLTVTGSRGFKQTTTRSNLVAKQVISIQSALSLGFISQLWVDTTSVSSCYINHLF